MIGSRKKRHEQLMNKPLPEEWMSIIQRNVTYYSCLTPDTRQKLQGLIQVFLAEKHFEGCGGLDITDEVRITIAAQACILLLGHETDIYPKLQTVLVYPHAYIAHMTQRHSDGTVMESLQVRIGETWSQGSLVLAWDDVKQSASDVHDGHNVVFHEFAHQLDYESGSAEGAPRLPNRSSYIAWARVLGKEYQSLLDNLEHHRKTLLNSYAATNPAEFFAVVTEFFFEKPVQLKNCHPELYEQLRMFYQQDPVSMMNTC